MSDNRNIASAYRDVVTEEVGTTQEELRIAILQVLESQFSPDAMSDPLVETEVNKFVVKMWSLMATTDDNERLKRRQIRMTKDTLAPYFRKIDNTIGD